DRDPVAQQPGEVVGADVVGWVDASRLHVLAVVVVEVVVDGEQQPARSYRVEQRPYGRLAGGLGQRRVLHRHEVERAGRERYLQGVSADPLHRGAVQLSSLPGPRYGDVGDVDRSDGPAPLSEPDRVGTLATTDVEHPARGQGADLGDEPPVRPPAPHRPVTLAVPRVPLGGLLRHAKLLLTVFVPEHVRQDNRLQHVQITLGGRAAGFTAEIASGGRKRTYVASFGSAA